MQRAGERENDALVCFSERLHRDFSDNRCLFVVLVLQRVHVLKYDFHGERVQNL